MNPLGWVDCSDGSPLASPAVLLLSAFPLIPIGHALILGAPVGYHLRGTQHSSQGRCLLQEMYRCELCGETMPPRTRAHRIIVETRDRTCPARERVNRVVKWVNGRRKVLWTDDPGGNGEEPVREGLVCPTCFASQD
jgi:hypothetical protein